jgi:hypothetical protein
VLIILCKLKTTSLLIWLAPGIGEVGAGCHIFCQACSETVCGWGGYNRGGKYVPLYDGAGDEAGFILVYPGVNVLAFEGMG